MFFILGDGLQIGVYDKHLKSKGLLSTIKSSSANLYVLASLEKKSKNLDELLLLNSDKRPVEGTNSNLFIFKEGKIFTPPLSEGPLLGCMRSLVLDHFAVEEAALKLKDIQTADEIFSLTVMVYAMSRSLGNLITTPIRYQRKSSKN